MRNTFGKFKKGPLFISIALLVLACLIFFFLLQRINNNHETADQAEMEWQTETARKEEIKSLDRLLKTEEVDRTMIDTHFIQSSDVVPFLDTAEELASQVGARAEVVSVRIASDNKSLLVGLRAEGTFESLYKLLILMENSSYQLELSSLDMEKREGSDFSESSSRAWRASFEIKLLSFIQ